MSESFDCGELGEFGCDFSLPEELADPFHEPESYKKEDANSLHLNGCVSQLHYA